MPSDRFDRSGRKLGAKRLEGLFTWFRSIVAIALFSLTATTAWGQTPIHVPGDHPTIQGAINAASNGDEIFVGPGTYNEAINFDGKAVHLHSSEGPDVTIIDATGLDTSVVQCVRGEGPDTILEGFTITGGSAFEGGGMLNERSSPTVRNCRFEDNSASWGGGMANFGSSPTVTDCVFEGNSASDGGGIYNEGSSPTVTNCIFEGNWAIWDGGGMLNDVGNPTVTDCVFKGNSGVGGGIYNEDSSPTVTNCLFEDNVGGGMRNVHHGNPTVTNSVFKGNSASTGGGMRNSHLSNPTVTNCVFEGNSADSGGGMWNLDSSPIVTDSLFEGNSASTRGGGMWNDESSPTVTNCVFERNSAGQNGGGIFSFSDSVPEVGDSFFCENAPDHMEGPWSDLGGNDFEAICAPLPGPPRVEVATDAETLWPPNNKLRDVQVVVTASGGCHEPEATCQLVSVLLSSSEPDSGAADSHGQDGFTAPVDITDAFTWDPDYGDDGAWTAIIQLRAQRAGSGKGRTYNIEARAEDIFARSDTDSAAVVVPHNQGNRRGRNR